MSLLVYVGAGLAGLGVQYLIIRLAIQHALSRVLAPSMLHPALRPSSSRPPW